MIRFGVAGYPLAFEASAFRKSRSGVMPWLAGMGLDALELQMTYGPRTTPENCRALRAAAGDWGIRLSIHASYFIVFTSVEPEKVQQSHDTLLRTFERADLLGAKEIILHPGPLYGGPEGDARERFIDNAGEFMANFGPTDIGLFAETAGKCGQLGGLEDILALCDAVPGVFPCLDFGHLHARSLGVLGKPDAFEPMVERLLAYEAARPDARWHFHYTPIEWGPRGEIQHRAIADMRDSEGFLPSEPYLPRPEPVRALLNRLRGDFTVISETHNSQEVGALALKAA